VAVLVLAAEALAANAGLLPPTEYQNIQKRSFTGQHSDLAAS
jgi:hypothetical protein